MVCTTKKKLIGTGYFSRVYLNPDKKTVSIKSFCQVKEAMAHGWFPNSHRFPKLTFDETNQLGCYKGKFLKVPKTVKQLQNLLKPSEFILYIHLQTLHGESRRCKDSRQLKRVIKDFKEIPRHIRKTLIQAVEVCENYGDSVAFEIRPENVAVSKQGKLILLDCFYIAKQLTEPKPEGIEKLWKA